jgi:hypothetical protein
MLNDAPPGWPRLDVAVRLDPGPEPAEERISDRAATLRLLSGGWVEVDRASATATFRMRSRPSARALVHPHLAAPAAAAGYWLGRESFHAGAFVLDGRAWGVLGERGDGKSSLLACLARAGIEILCDDVLAVDRMTAFAGPRAIDLRRDAAGQLGVGEAIGLVGLRERWRVTLGRVEPQLPLEGWLTLRWDSRVDVRAVQGRHRLTALLARRVILVPPARQDALIELSTLPMLELHRPRSWESAGRVVDALLSAVTR